MAEQTLFKNALTNILSTNPFVGDGFKYNDIYVNNTNREAILKEEIEKGIATTKAELDRERQTLDEKRRALNDETQKINERIASGIEDERKNLIAYRRKLLEADIARKLQASLQADKDAAEITSLTQALEEKSKALVEAEAKIRALEVETEKQKQQIDTLTNSNNVNTDLKNQLDNIVNENKELAASIVKCEADLAKCEAARDQCDKENAELLRRLRLCETENDALTEKNKNLMQELDDLTHDYRTYYAETVIKLEACRKHIVALNNRNTTNRDSLHDLVAATVQIAALNDVISTIQQRLTHCEGEINRLNNVIHQLEHDIQQCQGEKAAIQAEILRLEGEIQTLRRDNQNLNNQLQALQPTQHQLQQELAILQANHKQLVEELARKTIECQATIEQNDKDCFEQIVQRELIIQNLTDKLNQAPTDDYKREYATEFLKVAALTKALQQAKFEHNIAIILQSTAYQDALNAQPKNSVTLNIQSKLNEAILKKRLLLAKADKNKALLEEQVGCAIRLENQKLDYEGQLQELSNVLNGIKQVYPNSNVELLHNPNP